MLITHSNLLRPKEESFILYYGKNSCFPFLLQSVLANLPIKPVRDKKKRRNYKLQGSQGLTYMAQMNGWPGWKTQSHSYLANEGAGLGKVRKSFGKWDCRWLLLLALSLNLQMVHFTSLVGLSNGKNVMLLLSACYYTTHFRITVFFGFSNVNGGHLHFFTRNVFDMENLFLGSML